jgi:GTPase SAR1 family protein
MASHPLSAPPPSQPEAPIPSAPPTILKFVLIGDAATGKTAFRERFIRDRFTGIYRATIGCDFLGRVVQVDRVPGYDIDAEDGNETEAEPRGPDEARLQVWDTAGELLPLTARLERSFAQVADSLSSGQERFRSLAPAFYRSSDACLLLYSLASSLSPTKTAESITTWFHEFSTKCPVDDPRLFSWACVGTKADEVRGDPEREKRAREIQDEVERALRKLMPRRVVEVGGSNGDKQKRRRAARVGNGVEQARPPPTVSVEVLPPKGSKEAAARRRQKLAAARATSSTTSIAQDELPKVVVDGEQVAPSALDPHSSNRDPNLLIDRPSTSRTSTANSTTSSNAASVATATTTGTAATFELDAPLSDLLYATSPPPAPAHFGPAGAPPAVYIGGPYRDPEGRLLGSEDVDAVLEEGGGAPDHRREGLEQAEDQNQDLDELERDAEEIGEGQAEGEEGCKLEEEEERYEDQGIRHFRWTSAKTGEGVQEV